VNATSATSSGFTQRAAERGRGHPKGVQPRAETPHGLVGEAGADLAHVDETVPGLVNAEEECAETGSRSLRLGEAADHDLLLLDALDLQPASTSPSLVVAVAPLGHDAL
jgi:hypothetical protein